MAERCGLRCNRVTDTGVCRRCAALLHRDLTEMPELWVRLHTQLTPGSGVGDKVSGSREQPIGVRVDVLSLIGPAGDPPTPRDQIGDAPILDTLTTWAMLITEERHLAGPRHDITGLSAFLLAHNGWAVERPWADDYAEEVRRAAHTARRHTGLLDALPERMGAPCPHCDALALQRAPGDDWIECGGCGRLISPAEYDTWHRMYAANPRSVA